MKGVTRPVKVSDEVLHRDMIDHKNIIRIEIARKSRHSIRGVKTSEAEWSSDSIVDPFFSSYRKCTQEFLKVIESSTRTRDKFIPSVSAYILCLIHFVPLFRRRQNKVWFHILRTNARAK